MARGRRRGRGGAKSICVDAERAQRGVRLGLAQQGVARLLLGDGARRRRLRGRRRRPGRGTAARGRRGRRRGGRRAVLVGVRDAQPAEGLRQAQVAVHRGSLGAAQAGSEREVTGSKGTARGASGATGSEGAAEAGNRGMGAPRGQNVGACSYGPSR
jgi:hypothetical protein